MVLPDDHQDRDYFIFNNNMLFNPKKGIVSLVDDMDAFFKLSAPTARLLQEFLWSNKEDLSREILITRVWEAFGYRPSGNNLNKSISELRKCLQTLSSCGDIIITIPRYGFRFETNVVLHGHDQERVVLHNSAPEEIHELNSTIKNTISRKSALIPDNKIWLNFFLIVLLAISFIFYCVYFSRADNKIRGTNRKVNPVDGCSINLMNDFNRPVNYGLLAKRLKENNIDCNGQKYDIYYSSVRFTIPFADEIFIGACPVSNSSYCKSIRYMSVLDG